MIVFFRLSALFDHDIIFCLIVWKTIKWDVTHWCTKNFMVLIWGHLEAIPTFTSQKPWISFFQKTPHQPSPKPCHTDQLGHVQNTQNSKHSCTKNFMVLIWGHLEANPTFTSQKPWISVFHKIPHQAIYLIRATPTNLAMCKTYRTQNICAPTILWYSCRDIWRQFQPSHLKNHKFHFFHKTLHQAYLSRATPTNLAICKRHRTQNIPAPRIFWYSFGDTWRPFQTLHLKNHEFHFFTKHPTKSSS